MLRMLLLISMRTSFSNRKIREKSAWLDRYRAQSFGSGQRFRDGHNMLHRSETNKIMYRTACRWTEFSSTAQFVLVFPKRNVSPTKSKNMGESFLCLARTILTSNSAREDPANAN